MSILRVAPSRSDNLPHRLMVDVTNPDGSPNARIVADDSVAHHPELLQAAGKQAAWRCTIQRFKPASWPPSNGSGAPES